MGRWTHIAPAALLAASLSTGPAPADTPPDPLRFFADCAGRLSAELAYLWMFSDPASDETEAVRDAIVAVLETMALPDDGPRVRAWQIEARAAHDGLLSRAVFRADPWAAEMAERRVNACAALVVAPVEPAILAEAS